MRSIVCDTGPILHLSEAGLLELLQDAGSVLISDSIHAELVELLHPSWEREKPSWITVERLSDGESREAELLMSAGLMDYAEASAILLAKRLNADWFITDDAAARIYAASLGVEVHGSLGLVLWSAAAGRRDYERSCGDLDRLAGTSLWISKGILSEAHAALRKIFNKS